jgi:hypothetical protein
MLAASLRTRLSNDAAIAGTEGMVRLHEPLYRPDGFSIVRTSRLGLRVPPRARAHLRRSRWLAGVYGALRAALPLSLRGGSVVVRRHVGNGAQYEALEAMRCLRAGELESPIMPLDETERVMETLDAIRASWQNA